MRRQTRYFIISILLHCFLLMGFITFVKQLPQKLGVNEREVIISFLDQPHSLRAEKQSNPEKGGIASRTVRKDKLVQKHKPIPLHPSHSQTTDKPAPELLIFLHKEIQQHQRYPQSALAMEREGIVTVMFTLYTNGSIDHLQLVKSSGTTSLDNAALAAVNQSVPFKGVDKYLKQTKDYQIDVVFELA